MLCWRFYEPVDFSVTVRCRAGISGSASAASPLLTSALDRGGHGIGRRGHAHLTVVGRLALAPAEIGSATALAVKI